MNPWQQIEAKIMDWPKAQLARQGWRETGERVVFTNGCFDLLHYGHLYYLAEARAQGERLVIGLNASSSVSRLKGPHRPIKDEKSRAYLLAGLACVDAVVVFEQDTPRELIELLRPDVLVKGGDWAVEQIVGHDIVLAEGGEVKSLAFIPGYSTTLLEEKIKREV